MVIRLTTYFGQLSLLIACALLHASPAWAQANRQLLWQIGIPDGGNAEFALAPNQYGRYSEDGFFVVGRSDAKRDWPYAHPGPFDSWAGGKPHTFAILFGLQTTPESGECKLQVRLVDSHASAPPELKVTLNQQAVSARIQQGGGDASIFGNSKSGKPHSLELAFPASALKNGPNEITITAAAGSWMLYDWIGFETPAGAALTETSGTVLSTVDSPPVLIDMNGKLQRELEVVIRHLGAPAPAQLRIDGALATNISLTGPTERLKLPLPNFESDKTVSVSLHTGGKITGSRELPLKPVRKWVVYLLPHSHVDIGYTHVQTEVEQAQWRYLEMALEAARKSANYPAGARFKWNAEVLWAVDSYLRRASPEKQRTFFDAVRAGWVGLDALYGNQLTGLCRPEELVRLVRPATQLAQRSGVPIESAMITDVPGYTWGMVSTFAHSGVKYFSIGPNGGDRIGYTAAAWGDKPFWWIGPNGKDKVLVWMTGTGYYRVLESPQRLHTYLAALESKGYPYEMVQVRHCLGDNGAPDVDFSDTVRKWNETYAYPKLVIATTAEMFREFENRHGANLPMAKGDFTPYWEDGAASSARETALNRASADRLTQAEALFAMLNPKSRPAEEFYQAWRNVLLYDEHTWGAHNSISEPDAPFVKSQWAIKQAFALDADKDSRRLLHAALASSAAGGVVKGALDVFNTCSWPRTDLVLIPANQSDLPAGNRLEITDSRARAVPSQVLTSGELAFVAHDVPAFGSSRFNVSVAIGSGSKGSAYEPAADNILSNSKFTLRVDETTGAITSLRCKGFKGELAMSGETALNEYLYLPGTDLKGLQRNGPVKITVKERGPIVASLLVESDAPGCNGLTREIRLIEGLDFVEVINVVDKKAVRAKEGVHFGFGFNVPDCTVRMDVPWAVVRAETDQIPGACKNWFTVQRWADVSNDRYGITWATPDAPLMQIGGITANLVGSLNNPAIWMDKIESAPRLYSWAMNNHWHTNYRAEQDGPTTFRYYLRPHKAFRADEAARFGTDRSQPLIATAARGKKPMLPLLQLSTDKVILTGLKTADDGQGLIARLFGASGEPERVKLTWNGTTPRYVWLSDVSERPLATTDGFVEVPPWGIVTIRAELP